MLYLIGLGLRNSDIAQNGVDALTQVDVGYAELYTNSIEYDLDGLSEQTGTDITVLERSEVEEQDKVLTAAEDKDVAFVVSGDPLTATTHQDILFRAHKRGIETEVIHAPSILTAVAETGLSIYKFGRTTTLPKPYKGKVPDSPFDVIENNKEQGLHTLMLLDIGMEAADALEIIAPHIAADEQILFFSELGTENRCIRKGTIAELGTVTDEFGVPCALIVLGDVSENEQERVEHWEVA